METSIKMIDTRKRSKRTEQDGSFYLSLSLTDQMKHKLAVESCGFQRYDLSNFC